MPSELIERLVFAAGPSALWPRAAGDRTVRLKGSPVPREEPLADISALADEAAERVRRSLPVWIWQWVSARRALELHAFPGGVSWWWYAPVSEKNPLRSPFLREIYWLTLLDVILIRHTVREILWIGGDQPLARLAKQVAAKRNVPCRIHRSGSRSAGLGKTFLRRVRLAFSQLVKAIFLKILGIGDFPPPGERPVVLFYSLFPSLWERSEPHWRARMYGSFPDFLARRGAAVLYAGHWIGARLPELWRERRLLKSQCVSNRIVLLDTVLPLWRVVAARWPIRFWMKYAIWRIRSRRQPTLYEGLEVGELWWREMDQSVLSMELGDDLAIAEAMGRVAKAFPSLRLLFHQFEFQPLERALKTGARMLPDLKVVGVQSGMYSSNQLGFNFLAEEVCRNGEAFKAPMPEYLCAYGELARRVFSERLGAERICLTGAIRYAYLSEARGPGRELRKELGLHPQAVLLPVLTSVARQESVALLEGSFSALDKFPELVLLIRFHYLLPLEDIVKRQGRDPARFRIVRTEVPDLVRQAPAMVGGGSSTAMEAIHAGCMPLVYRPVNEMACNPMLEVPDSVYLWNTPEELRNALRSCLIRDEPYTKRRGRWPEALRLHMGPADDSANERLFDFLKKWGEL
jgi:hypothetical protein